MCCGCIERYQVEEDVEPVLNFVTVTVGLWMRQLEDNPILHVIVADNNYEDQHVDLAIEQLSVPRTVNWMGLMEPADYEVEQARDFLLVFARMPFEWRVSAGAIQDRCIDYESMLLIPESTAPDQSLPPDHPVDISPRASYSSGSDAALLSLSAISAGG